MFHQFSLVFFEHTKHQYPHHIMSCTLGSLWQNPNLILVHMAKELCRDHTAQFLILNDPRLVRMAIVWSGWWINLFGSKLKVCYSRHICMHTNYKCSEETEETWRDHNPFVTVLGDHLQSEKTRDWTFVCHGHPPKKMTCCLPPVKLTRDKTVHSAPRTQKSLSIDKERVTRSRGQTKYPTNHGALWYNEETLRKKTLKLYTFTHGFVGFKPSNSLPPTVFL